MTIPQGNLLVRYSGVLLNHPLRNLAMTLLLIFVIFILTIEIPANYNVIGDQLSAVQAQVENSQSPRPVQPLEPRLAPQTLTPSMTAALDYVAKRYRVSADALRPIFEVVQTVASQHQLDPLLLVAVISIESRFNPFSESARGAQGLMQIIPRYHQDKLPGDSPEQPFLDPVSNVRIGALILHQAIRRQGSLLEGLQYYGGAAADDERLYAKKVIAEKYRMEQAPHRRESLAVPAT